MFNAKRPVGASNRTLQPTLVTLEEARQVSGGGSNVRHGNPGGEPASYNTPGKPGYGMAKD